MNPYLPRPKSNRDRSFLSMSCLANVEWGHIFFFFFCQRFVFQLIIFSLKYQFLETTYKWAILRNVPQRVRIVLSGQLLIQFNRL